MQRTAEVGDTFLSGELNHYYEIKDVTDSGYIGEWMWPGEGREFQLTGEFEQEGGVPEEDTFIPEDDGDANFQLCCDMMLLSTARRN